MCFLKKKSVLLADPAVVRVVLPNPRCPSKKCTDMFILMKAVADLFKIVTIEPNNVILNLR